MEVTIPTQDSDISDSDENSSSDDSVALSERKSKFIESYSCEKCGKTYKTEWALERHKVKHEFNCKKCLRQFDNAKELKEHSEKHTEDSNFVCSECGNGFTQKVRLITHLRVIVHNLKSFLWIYLEFYLFLDSYGGTAAFM